MENNHVSQDESPIAPGPEQEKKIGSVVYRIESLLAGADFDEMESVVNARYEEYQERYVERINAISERLFSLPPDEDDAEYQQYLADLELLKKDVKSIGLHERAHIVDLYNKAVQNLEQKKADADLDNLPSTMIFEEEEFSINAINSDYIMERLINRLIPIIVMPERAKLMSQIGQYLDQLKRNQDNQENKYCLAVSNKALFEHYDEVKELCKKIKQRGKKVELVIDRYNDEWSGNTFETRVPYSYTEEEMQKLYNFYREVRGKGGFEIYFSEFFNEELIPIHRENLWTFDEVAFSNYKKQEYLQYLKKLKLSPFPTLLAIHKHVTQKRYSGMASTDEKTRTFLTAEESETEEDEIELMKQGKAFVCTCVASYAKALVDDLNDKNLQCKLISVAYYDSITREKRSDGCHMMLLVKIADEKYGTTGYYIWDPTADIEGWGYANCLFPVYDLDRSLRPVVVGENENISKTEAFLHPKRSDNVQKKFMLNVPFNNRYAADSPPIPLLKFEEALSEVYAKMKSTKTTYQEDERVEYLEPLNLVIMDFNQTIKGLDSFEPATAENAFYKQMRDFYRRSSDPEFEFWEDNWTRLNKKMTFTPEDFEPKK